MHIGGEPLQVKMLSVELKSFQLVCIEVLRSFGYDVVDDTAQEA